MEEWAGTGAIGSLGGCGCVGGVGSGWGEDGACAMNVNDGGVDAARWMRGLDAFGVPGDGALDGLVCFVAVDEEGVSMVVEYSLSAMAVSLGGEGKWFRVLSGDAEVVKWIGESRESEGGMAEGTGEYFLEQDRELGCWRLDWDGSEDFGDPSKLEAWRRQRVDIGVKCDVVAYEGGCLHLGLPANYCYEPGDTAFADRVCEVTRSFVERRLGVAVGAVSSVPGHVEVNFTGELREGDVLNTRAANCAFLCEWLSALDAEISAQVWCGAVKDQFEAARVLIGAGIDDRPALKAFRESAIRRGDVVEAELADRAVGAVRQHGYAVCVDSEVGGLQVLGAGLTESGALADVVRRVGDGGRFYPMHVHRQWESVLEEGGVEFPLGGVESLRKLFRGCMPDFVEWAGGKSGVFRAAPGKVNSEGTLLAGAHRAIEKVSENDIPW